MRIPSKDFISVCDTNAAVNTTWHINHDNCTAGVDTRSRLYVTKKDNDTFVAYCHNCAGWGVVRAKLKGGEWVKYVPRSRATDVVELPSSSEPEHLPNDLVFDPVLWPIEVRDWCAKHYIVDSSGSFINTEYGNFFAYSPSLNRLVIRIGSFWQARDCTGVSKLKYYTGMNQTKSLPLVPSASYGADKVKRLYITEDMTSAIRLAQAGVPAIPLCGTTAHDLPALVNICKQFSGVVLWLDHDKAGQVGTLKLRNRLTLSGVDVLCSYVSVEAKTMSPALLATTIGVL